MATLSVPVKKKINFKRAFLPYLYLLPAFIVLGAAFASIAVSFSRFTKDNSVLKLLQWVLLAGFVGLSFYIHSQTGAFTAAPPASTP